MGSKISASIDPTWYRKESHDLAVGADRNDAIVKSDGCLVGALLIRSEVEVVGHLEWHAKW